MVQGTTPTHSFTLPFPTESIKAVRIIYAQNDKPIIVKNTDDCTLQDNTVSVRLSQTETLSISADNIYFVQVRVVDRAGNSFVSKPIGRTVIKCYDGEVLV